MDGCELLQIVSFKFVGKRLVISGTGCSFTVIVARH